MEAQMNLHRMGFVLLVAVLSMVASPAWSQDAATSTAPAVEAQSQSPAAEASAPPAAEVQGQAPAAEAPEAPATEAPATEAPATEARGQAPAAEPSAQAASVVQIEDAVVCQDVVDRKPVAAGDQFAKETPKVYCFCRVVGAQAGSQITHNWYFNGALKASVKLHVGSTDFRTWSSKTLPPGGVGEWMVEILSDDGKPLENITFVVR
jgi:hypothetical protein